jgi:hypothetical protein
VTLTTTDPVSPGTWLQLPGERLLKVTRCTGQGPFTLTLRHVTWWDRFRMRMWARKRRLRNWWLETRCLPDHGWCWRKATADSLCDRHWLRAVEDGGEYL